MDMLEIALDDIFGNDEYAKEEARLEAENLQCNPIKNEE